MRIGLFTDAYRPIVSGVTNSVDTLADGLRELGHEVFIIANAHKNAVDDPYVLRIRGVPLPMKGMHDYRISKVTKKKVKRILDLQLDIVHCHTEFTMGQLGRKAAKKAKIPVVMTYHTMYDDYVHFVSKSLVVPLRFMAKWYVQGFANKAQAVIYPTVKVERTFRKYKIKTYSTIVPSGIPMKHFVDSGVNKEEQQVIKTRLGVKDDDFVLLFLGRVSREKSISTLIDHVAKIPHDNVKMLIVGDGPDRELFEKQAEKLGATNIIFVGMIQPDKVGDYYHLADLFVNFSISETQGLTYIESLASGTPVLVKYDDNLEGVITNGTNGFTFKDDNEFLTLFEHIYQDSKLLKRLNENANNALDEYSQATYAMRVEAIYKSLVRG